MQNEQQPSNPNDEMRKYSEEERTIARELDVINTQMYPQWQDDSSLPSEYLAEGLIGDVERMLDASQGELQSEGELNILLKKLDTAIAINNEPYARDLRQRLIERFRKED